MLREPLPSHLAALIATDSQPADVRLALCSDLDLSGEPARHWLAVTDTTLFVLRESDPAQIVRRLAIAGAEAFRSIAAVGSGFLQARIEGVWVDLVRYSNALADPFTRAARKLEQRRDGGALAIDPADEIDRRHCANCGMALRFAGDVCPRCIDRGAVLGRVWQLVRPYRRAAVGMLALLVLGVAAELVPPKLQQYLVDHVLHLDHADRLDGRIAVLLLIVVGLAATRLLLVFVNEFKGRLSSRVGTSMTYDLRARLVAKLHELSVGYYDRHQVGVLVNRVAHDTEAMHGLVQQLTGGFLLQLLQLVGVGVMLFTLNPRMALYTLIPMPLVMAGSAFFWRNVYPRYYRYWDSASKQAGALSGMLSGIRVVKAFGQEEREGQRFATSSTYLQRSRLGVEHATTTFSAVMQLVFSLGGLIVWFVGGKDVLGDRMTLGSLMAFLAYLQMFYSPLSTLAGLTTWLTSFMTASQRIFELLDTPLQVADADAPAAVESVAGRITFDNVTFGYDRHQPVIERVSLEIAPGEMVGVVGRSGSGKTTLVNLVSRFYDVDEGRVLIDGVDVRQFERHTLRRNIGVVLQEPFLFRGSVWDNLVYGRPEASPEQGIEAARAANCHDFIIALPFGYDTALGERGAGLSGGERQRISIARALLFDPRILILDEATSNVDTESEKSIQEALRILARGRTTIAIAHRLSTLRNADRILVFDRGRLIEEGSHERLLAADGTYARLVRMQTQLTRAPTVDRLAVEAAPPAPAAPLPAPTVDESTEPPAFRTRWLLPDMARIHLGNHDALHVTVSGDRIYGGVSAAWAFPVRRADEFISLRHADADGRDAEIGMIRDLSAWPADAARLVRQALRRRYYVREICAIRELRLEHGFLLFAVDTDRGPAEFTMRWNHSQATDYGPAGKIIVDVDDNRFVVKDVAALPARQRGLFQRYIYW